MCSIIKRQGFQQDDMQKLLANKIHLKCDSYIVNYNYNSTSCTTDEGSCIAAETFGIKNIY